MGWFQKSRNQTKKKLKISTTSKNSTKYLDLLTDRDRDLDLLEERE